MARREHATTTTTPTAVPANHPHLARHTPTSDAAQYPGGEAREDYAQAGTDRYASLEADIAEVLEREGGAESSPERLATAVAAWLVAAQQSENVRPTSVGDIGSWVDDPIEDAYRDGVTDARAALRDAGVALDRSNATARLDHPRHRQRLSDRRAAQRALWTQLARDLEADIEQTVRAAAGQVPTASELAGTVADRVEKVGGHRARLIGETEPAAAYHSGTLQEYDLVGATQVELAWETVGDRRTCARCEAGSAGSPYALEEARGLLPHHPLCRCWFTPVASSLRGMRQ